MNNTHNASTAGHLHTNVPTQETGTVVVTYGCGLPDRFVAAIRRATVARSGPKAPDAVTAASVDNIRANRFAANSTRAPALEGRAMILVESCQGFEWSYVRVEKCADGRWHAAGVSA